MNIRRKIWSLPAIAVGIFAVGIAFSYFFSKQTSESLLVTERINYPFMEKSQRLIGTLQQIQDYLRNAVTEGDQAGLDQAKRLAAEFSTTANQIAELSGKEAVARQIRSEFDLYFAEAMKATQALMANSAGDTSASIARMQQTQKALENTLENAKTGAQRQFAASLDHGAVSAQRALAANVLSAVLIMAVLLLTAHLVVRSIWGELGGEPEFAAKIMRGMAAGDLTARVDIAKGAENSLLASVSSMQHSLSDLITDIRTLAEHVSHSSTEISAGNGDLSGRTEEQAASLEETAATMEELTSTVKQNQANAKQAENLSLSNAARAQQGAEAMDGALATMTELTSGSKQIVDIIGVIESIAFQTNILALNAAVEAARAGEHGRGFAVVASEVRNLAQRCSQAAKEIRSLLQSSVAKVQQGAQRTESAGATVRQIAESAREISSMITEIASASEQQAEGIEQVNQTVVQLEGVTQRNAALVEESASAAEALKDQAAQLVQALGVFKLIQRSSANLQGADIAGPRKSDAPMRKIVASAKRMRRLPQGRS